MLYTLILRIMRTVYWQMYSILALCRLSYELLRLTGPNAMVILPTTHLNRTGGVDYDEN